MANEHELIFSDVAGGNVGWQPTLASRGSPRPVAAVRERWFIAVMIAFWVVTILGATSRSTAAALELAFTPAAIAIGFWLWRMSPAAYLSFICQLFLFTCLIRRLADSQLGWNAVNPIVVAPYLSLLWCGVALLRPRRQFLRSFGLVAIGLLWALTIGVMRNGISAAGFAMLEWSAGPLIACYLITIPSDPNSLRSSLFWTALMGTIVMAFYGIAQYIAPPAWDQYWIISAKMAPTIGLEPGGLRVFSTMNSPWPFAMTLMALLVYTIGFGGSVPLRALAVLSGLIALIASQTRAAWGGLVVGWIILSFGAGRARRRLIGAAGLIVVIGGLAVVALPSARELTARVATLGSLGSDDSLSVRTRFYQSFIIEAISQPIGAGLGRTGVATRLSNDGLMLNFDSGIMNVPYVLGWVGAIAYVGGLGALILTVARKRKQLSPTGLAAAAACVGLLSQIPFLNSLIGASGVIFWILLAVCLHDVRTISQPSRSLA